MARGLFDRRHPKPISKNGIDGLKALGAPDAYIAKLTRHRADRPRSIIIHPDNWQAVSLFLGSMTQWRIVTTGNGNVLRSGLDYTALKVLAEAEGVTLDRPTMARLQKLEAEAMNIWTEQRRHAA